MMVRVADPFNFGACQQQLQLQRALLRDQGRGVDLAAAREAILAGADPHLLDLPSLSCPLHMVISLGSTEGLNFLLDQGVNPLHVLLVARPGQLFATLAKDDALKERVWRALNRPETLDFLTRLSSPEHAKLWRYGQEMTMQNAWTSWMLLLA